MHRIPAKIVNIAYRTIWITSVAYSQISLTAFIFHSKLDADNAQKPLKCIVYDSEGKCCMRKVVKRTRPSLWSRLYKRKADNVQQTDTPSTFAYRKRQGNTECNVRRKGWHTPKCNCVALSVSTWIPFRKLVFQCGKTSTHATCHV